MLGKLLKYELKATGRTFMPIYAAMLIAAAVTKLISALTAGGSEVPEFISAIVYSMILMGMFVMTFVVMIQRFHKNLLSDEGYLMFTLPVEPWQHIVSKLLISVLWNLGSLVAAFLSIVILTFDEIANRALMLDLFAVIAEFLTIFGPTGSLVVLEIFLAGIATTVFGILLIYASIALGHLSNRHRTMASLGAFLGLTAFAQILFACLTLIPNVRVLQHYMDTLQESLQTSIALFHYVMWFTIGFFTLLSAGYFLITNHILKKRLNLE